MTNNVRRTQIAAAVLLALGSIPGQAQVAPGFYIGANVGTTSVDLDDFALDEDEVPGLASGRDGSDIGYALAAGYRFSPYFAVEAAYFDLGKFSLLRAEEEDMALDLGLVSRGPALSLLGAWPINNIWSLEGRVGAYFGKSKLKASFTGGIDAADVSLDSGSHTSLLLGAGIVASFGERWAARLGYTWLDKAARISLADLETDWNSSGGRILLGIQYSF